MTIRSYKVVGRGFILSGQIDHTRYQALVRALEGAAGKIDADAQREKPEITDHEAYGAMIRTTEPVKE
jgi:hypothetical protein